MKPLNQYGRALPIAAAAVMSAVVAIFLLSGCSKKPVRHSIRETPAAAEEAGSEHAAPAVVTMDSNITVTANFRPIAYGLLIDSRDGRTYKTVKMPDGMAWMAENLNYAPPSGNGWVYRNNTSYSDKYGRLYDWETAKTVCPDGWHLPTRQEWDDLGKALGGKREVNKDGNIHWRGAGKKLKATGGWGENSMKHNDIGASNWNGTDDYGFSALPGGDLCGVDCYGGGYYGAGDDDVLSVEYGSWWTATPAAVTKYGVKQAYYRRIFLKSADLEESETSGSDGNSVRCVTGADGFVPTEAAAMTATHTLTLKAADGGTVSANPVKTVYTAGEKVTISASPICGFAFAKWIGGETSDAASETTTVAVNSNITVTAKFTRVMPYLAHGAFTDARDGKKYKTAQICKYVWMAENLNYQTSSGSRCYDDKKTNCARYGRLYDWETASKACPSGWHLATDKEWEELEGHADGWEREINNRGTGVDRLKAKSGWKKYDEDRGGNGTDDFGFSALPGGAYDPDKDKNQDDDDDDDYFKAGEFGGWWSRGQKDAPILQFISYDYNSLETRPFDADLGASARCVNDKEGHVPAPTALTLKLNAAAGGTVSSNSNKKSYVAGERVTISAVPNRGYLFSKWTGGKIADTNSAITIVTIASNTAITAIFKKSGAPPAAYGSLTDARDGKVYETVLIDGKAWMAQNLNYETPDSSWCHGDSAANCAKYGRLYAWNTARTACPAGWHLPTDEEWDDLIKTAGGGKEAGKKLKAVFGWHSFGNGWIETGDGTDYYGFAALPGGRRNSNGSPGYRFDDINQYGYWWTATESDKRSGEAYYREIYMYNSNVYADDAPKTNGYSARCVMDKK